MVPNMKFIDYIQIHIESGHGGKGAVSFRREKFIPRGGPDGGDGGRGGNVVFRADRQLGTLLDLRYKQHYKAQNGANGRKKKMHGKDGEDLVISVPVGTVLTNAVTNQTIADLDRPGKEAIAAKGGRGGLGNAHFATATRQAPKFAQPGEPGEEKDIIVELKLLADVGLIGLPNAGKSTFISVISAAKPKVADYPFTTLEPVLGVVKFGDIRSFVVADIPGLIEGAHRGVGLGFQFLRHVERTRILLHLIDISQSATEDPVEAFMKINKELALYSPELIRKPQAVVATKIDAADKSKLDKLRSYSKEEKVEFFAISALGNEGIREVILYLSKELEMRL